LGQWGCYRTRVTGLDTTDMCVTQWYSNGVDEEKVIIDFCGLDGTGMHQTDGWSIFMHNPYSNTSQTQWAQPSNNSCSSSGNPHVCCTGNKTGTCNVTCDPGTGPYVYYDDNEDCYSQCEERVAHSVGSPCTTEVTYRFTDNTVITGGEPVSCETVFDAGIRLPTGVIAYQEPD
jgi:hypothetical protein